MTLKYQYAQQHNQSHNTNTVESKTSAIIHSIAKCCNHRSSKVTINNVKDCGVILINKSLDKILIVLQKVSKKWGLPKGHMTEEEYTNRLYFQCAKRELLEETGIVLSSSGYEKLGTVIINNKLFYIVKYNREEINLSPVDRDEIMFATWIPLSCLSNFVMRNTCNRTLCEFDNLLKRMTNNTTVIVKNFPYIDDGDISSKSAGTYVPSSLSHTKKYVIPALRRG